MTLLPQLRDQLVAVPTSAPAPAPHGRKGRRRLPSAPAPAPRGRTGRRRLPTAALAACLGLLLTAGALAATGVIPIGSAVKAPRQVNHDPHRGTGVPVSTTARVLPLRFPDPAGGPPWGLRIVTTSRGQTCVQAGRVVGGRLGVLGQDGVAGNDGRFHALPLAAAGAFGGGDCMNPDAAGHTFIARQGPTLASGPSPSRSCQAPGERNDGRAPCPTTNARNVIFGLLGPQAASITYTDGAEQRTQAVTAPEGAYLLVFAGPPRLNGSMFSDGPAIGFGIDHVDYRDGSRCPATPPSPKRLTTCAPVGYVPAKLDVKPSALRRRVTATRGRGGSGKFAYVKVSAAFRAPVAITDATSFYELTVGRSRGCRRETAPAQTRRDIRKGTLVRLFTGLSQPCHGRVSVTIRLVNTTTARAVDPGDGLLVGRTTVSIP